MGTKSYLIGQGYDNLKKHGGKTLSTMLIICATMLILGIFIIAFINIGQNIKVITENQGLQAFIASTGVDEVMIVSDIYEHQARLRSFELVAEVMKALSV